MNDKKCWSCIYKCYYSDCRSNDPCYYCKDHSNYKEKKRNAKKEEKNMDKQLKKVMLHKAIRSGHDLEQLKKAILHKAMKSGCDSDGDLIWYGGKLYYVHLFNNIVVEKNY